jgi:RNA:NAD 2'-phosphotransferase (TPT1/KptA family)
MNKQLIEASKFLSYVLRHHPDAIGVALDREGWADIDYLIAAASGIFMACTGNFRSIKTTNKNHYATSRPSQNPATASADSGRL